MLLSFPPHNHFVGQFLSRLDFVAQKLNIHTKCLIRAYWFWKAPKLCFDAKKVFRPLGQILTFFVLTESVFFTASTSLQGKLNFLVSSHNFLTFFEKMLFRKIVQYCPKLFKNLTFTSKKCSTRLVRFLHFLFWLKVCFLRFQPAWKESSIFLLHHTIFSHFWKNVVSKDQKCEKIVWWSNKMEVSL